MSVKHSVKSDFWWRRVEKSDLVVMMRGLQRTALPPSNSVAGFQG